MQFRLRRILSVGLVALAPIESVAQRSALEMLFRNESTQKNVQTVELTELKDVPFPGSYSTESGSYQLMKLQKSGSGDRWVPVADIGRIPLDDYRSNVAAGVAQSQSLGLLEGFVPDTRVRRASSRFAMPPAQSTVYVLLSRRTTRAFDHMRSVREAILAWSAKQEPLGFAGEHDLAAAARRIGDFDPIRSVAKFVAQSVRRDFARVEFIKDLSVPVPAGSYLLIYDIQYDIDIQRFLAAQNYKYLGDEKGYQPIDYGSVGRSHVFLDHQYQVHEEAIAAPQAMSARPLASGSVEIFIPTKTYFRVVRNLEIARALWFLEVQTAYVFGAPFDRAAPTLSAIYETGPRYERDFIQ